MLINPVQAKSQQLYLTAVTHQTCISVSGYPGALEVFKGKYLPSSTHSARYAAIYTLYHSPELADVKAEVMKDLSRRNVQFPTYAALSGNIRSTVTGKHVAEERSGYTLAEEVVDMTLLHPVNFDLVVDALNGDLKASKVSSIRFINKTLWGSIQNANGPSYTSLPLV